MALDDATELLDMVEQRRTLKEVRARFERLFDADGVMVWDAERS
jgi:hypothetical protein